jgi:hypothetical protein
MLNLRTEDISLGSRPSCHENVKAASNFRFLSMAIPRVHPALQNQDCGHLIDDLPPACNRHFSFAQQAVGLGRTQAFVPEVNRQGKMLTQLFCEALHFFGLDAFGPTHPQRVAHDDLGHLIFADHLFQLGEIQALVLPLDGFESLRSDTKGVRYGKADSFRPDV